MCKQKGVMFALAKNLDRGTNIYRRYDPNDGLEDWLNKLAEEYVSLRSEFVISLTEISFEGIEAFSTDQLREVIRRTTVPDPIGGNFDVVRSDLGELCSYLLQETVFSTRFAYKGIRDRELAGWPGRGIDALGVENYGNLNLVVGEAKVSGENASPPQVVDSSKDSLRNQHLRHITDLPNTIQQVFNTAKQARDEVTRSLFLIAGMYAQEGRWDRLNLISSSILVRCSEHYTDNDFGSFFLSPEDFAPSQIRFLVVCIPTDMPGLEMAWNDAVLSAKENQ